MPQGSTLELQILAPAVHSTVLLLFLEDVPTLQSLQILFQLLVSALYYAPPAFRKIRETFMQARVWTDLTEAST